MNTNTELRLKCAQFSNDERQILVSGLISKKLELEREIELLRNIKKTDGEKFTSNDFLAELEARLVDLETLYNCFY